MTLVEKLAPTRVRCSGRFTAMLAYFLGEQWTDPQITGMLVTSDGFLLLETTTDPFANEFVGEVDDLWKNLKGVSRAAELSKAEAAELLALARQKVRYA